MKKLISLFLILPLAATAAEPTLRQKAGKVLAYFAKNFVVPFVTKDTPLEKKPRDKKPETMQKKNGKDVDISR